jgi:uncharacterized protein (DUF1810 family)
MQRPWCRVVGDASGRIIKLTDGFDLERFVMAQEPVFDAALSELQAGRKRSHWMWFVFPQIRGLGSSSMAEYYGIGSLAEACAYLAHPVLGPRLDLCIRTVFEVEAASLHAIFGSPDDMKFHSCATLFAVAAGEGENPFQRALDRWCDGQPDEATLALLRYAQ